MPVVVAAESTLTFKATRFGSASPFHLERPVEGLEHGQCLLGTADFKAAEGKRYEGWYENGSNRTGKLRLRESKISHDKSFAFAVVLLLLRCK